MDYHVMISPNNCSGDSLQNPQRAGLHYISHPYADGESIEFGKKIGSETSALET